MKPNLTLNTDSRASYLAFVAEWKSSYKALSEAIRKLKTPKSLLAQRGYVETGDVVKDMAAKCKLINEVSNEGFVVVKAIWEALPKLGPLPDHCREGEMARRPDYSYGDTKLIANYMLALRKRGKVLANEAYQKSLQEQPVAA